MNAHSDGSDAAAWLDHAMPWLIGAYVVAVVAAWYTRTVTPHHHWTFPVFRQSYYHLIAQRNLYAPDPAQGYDLFKYSPTFAVLFAPIALLPAAAGLLVWDLLNALALLGAVRLVLPRRQAAIAAAVMLPEVFVAAQASQSNALVAALIVMAFVALERQRLTGAAIAIAVGTAIKLFPLAGLTFALPSRARWAFAWRFAAVGAALLVLPLGIIPAPLLAQQYRWWAGVESVDALARGASVLGLLSHVARGSWPNWPVQLAGTLVLLAPLVVRRQSWRDPQFLRLYLCSVLVYVVLFNHQAERPSYVIAVTGAAIWYAMSPAAWWRTVLALSTLVGLRAAPCLAVWIVIQVELWSLRATVEPAISRGATATYG